MSDNNIPELTVKAIQAQHVVEGMYLAIPTHKDSLLAVRFLKIAKVERALHINKFSHATPGIRILIDADKFRVFKNTDFVMVGMTEEPDVL